MFDARENLLLFPSRWLERPVPGADPQRLEFLKQRVAELDNEDRRTLAQRLKDDGTSFRAIVESGRYELACQLLANTRLPLNEIATALDHADPSVFTRAFRRWSGQSPSAWRGSGGRARR